MASRGSKKGTNLGVLVQIEGGRDHYHSWGEPEDRPYGGRSNLTRTEQQCECGARRFEVRGPIKILGRLDPDHLAPIDRARTPGHGRTGTHRYAHLDRSTP